MQTPTVICLTPVFNEKWILERFLQCASLWADHIVIADQGSTDGSRDIAARFPKVTLLNNSSQAYNEVSRQQLLLEAARKIPGPRVLIALDSDEFLTANVLTSPEWNTIRHAAPGTVIRFQWPEILCDESGLRYFNFPWDPPMGFVDDGSEHAGKVLHSDRLPVPPGAETLLPKEIKVMHYCQTDPDRYQSRSRWYQCWELLNQKRRPLDLFRFYNRDQCVSADVVKPVPADWIAAYQERDVDMTSVWRESSYRWDKEVLKFFAEHGTKKFKRLDIWKPDWNALHRQIDPAGANVSYESPRSWFDRIVHRWLRRTQQYFAHYGAPGLWRQFYLHFVEKVLRWIGW